MLDVHKKINSYIVRYFEFTKQAKTEISAVKFVILYVLFSLIAFQKPLLEYVISQSNFLSLQGVLYIISLEIAYFFVSSTILFFISFFTIFFLKIFCIATVLINSVALYFMIEYGVEFDRSMIANIINTDTKEAGDLWHFSIMPYFFFLGIVPSVIIWKTKISSFKWYNKIFYCAISLILLGIFAYIFSSTWLWYDQHGSGIGRRVLPWSYVVNTIQYYHKKTMSNRNQQLLPDAKFLSKPEKKQVFILVIGEAVRADHIRYYGYNRDTNPYTQNSGFQVFKIGKSCATNTLGSVACIVTHQGSKASPMTNFESIQSYLTRHNIETIVRTNNSGLPPVKVTHMESAGSIIDNCKEENCPRTKDEALNWGLSKIIEQSKSSRIFITLHQGGSHGPKYWEKYPDDFEHFKPVCKTVNLRECSSEMLINAYDNTLRYTDSLLLNIIDQLKGLNNVNSVMIYVADHGQSLGENGIYLHGVPIAFAPPEQYQIPFFVWMSDGFKKQKGIVGQNIITQETFPHDFVFHSVMGAFDMRSDIYKPEFDIFDIKK